MTRQTPEAVAARHIVALVTAHASGDREAIRKICRKLGSAMEYLLQDCVAYDLGHPWKFWCDGVATVEVLVTSPTSVKLVGYAYYGPCGSDWIAPLEAEIELAPSADSITSCRFRFGVNGDDGEIVRTPFNQSDPARDRLVRHRPHKDEDWWLNRDLKR
jgi:hypothetical protein